MSLMVANAVESGTTSNRNRIEDEAGFADESDGSDGIDGEVG